MDISNVNLWAAAIAIVLSALGAYITSMRVSRASASKAALEDQRVALENQQHALETVRLSYVALQQTYLDENKRVNNKLDESRNAYDSLLNKQAEDKVECLRQLADQQVQIIELNRQVTVLMAQGVDMVRKVVIVGTDIAVPVVGSDSSEPLPVKIVEPLPLPMTQAQAIAAAKEELKEEAK